MAYIQLHMFSEALGMQTEVEVVIPQTSTKGEIGTNNKQFDGKFKCLYLLHGLSDDETIWMRRTSIERYAADYGICVVMPSGAKSFYSDMKFGLNYYTYIAKELPRVIESMFNVSDKREDRYIAGISMGGYGAVKIALTETERYASAAALSLVSDIHNPTFTSVLQPVFGGEIPDSADIFYLSEQHNSDSIKPRIFITVGQNDFMINDTRRLNGHFEKLDYDYHYSESEGAHNWKVWDDAIQRALAWMFKEEH